MPKFLFPTYDRERKDKRAKIKIINSLLFVI